jgi:hypothetical protein
MNILNVTTKVGVASLSLILLHTCFNESAYAGNAVELDSALRTEIMKLSNRYWSVPSGSGPSIYKKFSKGVSGNHTVLKRYCSVRPPNALKKSTEFKKFIGIGADGPKTPQELVYWEAIQEVASTHVCPR